MHLLYSCRVVAGVQADQHGIPRTKDVGKGLEKFSSLAAVEVTCRGHVSQAGQSGMRAEIGSPTLEPRLMMHFCREAIDGSLSQIWPSS